ncbi:MAG: hypothetical protein ABIZ56_01760 [Chthoniobacteraceae bacterium]
MRTLAFTTPAFGRIAAYGGTVKISGTIGLVEGNMPITGDEWVVVQWRDDQR